MIGLRRKKVRILNRGTETEQFTVVSKQMFDSLRAQGVNKDVLRLEFYRPNDERLTPCLVVLSPKSLSGEPIEAELLRRRVYHAMDDTQRMFPSLSLCFISTVDGIEPHPGGEKLLLGSKPQLLLTAWERTRILTEV